MHALINGTRVHYACYLVVSAPPPSFGQNPKEQQLFFRETFPNFWENQSEFGDSN